MIDREKFPPLNLPVYAPKVRSNGDQIQIFDRFRKKYLKLTPEEWVRQHFTNYLCETLGYPSSLIQLEFEIDYNRLSKRPDIAVLNRDGRVEILVECKAPQIKLDQDVFLQVSTYFSVLRPRHVVLTNGIQHVFATVNQKDGKLVYIRELPAYS